MDGKNLEDLLQNLLDRLEALEAQNLMLQAALEKSELFFTIPEFQLMSATQLPSFTILAASVTQPHSNMYALEQDNDGIAYRWLGPRNITNYTLSLDRSQNRDCKIIFKSQIAPGFYASLKLYIDGTLQTYDAVEWRDGEGLEIRTTIESSNRAQDTLISVVTPEPVRPSDLVEKSTDDRPLSLAFVSLEVC